MTVASFTARRPLPTAVLTPWMLSTIACVAACSSSSSTPAGGGTMQDITDSGAETGLGAADSSSSVDDARATSEPDSEAGFDAPATVLDADSKESGTSGAGPCGAAGVVLCDDFEESAIDTGTWTVLLQANDPQSKLSLDTTHAKTGKQSLHSQISANAGRAMASETRTFPMSMNKVYGRAYLYFGSPVIPDHTSFVVVDGTSPFNAADRFGEQNGNWFMNFVSDKNASEMNVGGATAIVTDSWLCLQWAFDGTAGSFSESVDHVALDATGSDASKYKGPTFSSFRIGMETYGGGPESPTYDLWVDDVAIGTQPIDCLP